MGVVRLRMQGISLKILKSKYTSGMSRLLSTVSAKLLFVSTYVSHTKSPPRRDTEFSFHLICILKHCAHFTNFPGCTRLAVSIESIWRAEAPHCIFFFLHPDALLLLITLSIMALCSPGSSVAPIKRLPLLEFSGQWSRTRYQSDPEHSVQFV